VWTIIALLLVLQFATELIIGFNYGLGQILVTPMALLMSHLAAPNIAGAALALERVIDTARARRPASSWPSSFPA